MEYNEPVLNVEEDDRIVGDVDPDSPDSGGIRYTKEIPKLYMQCVHYKFSVTDNWKNAKIIGRSGKATECTSSG